MRCADRVMQAMSYHPRYQSGDIARAYWTFVAGWQTEAGGLHRVGAMQWHLLELASRFAFSSTRTILEKSLPLAIKRQKRDGGFHADFPALTACQVALAYARYRMLDRLLAGLRYDLRPLIQGLDTPLGLKTRREALGTPNQDDVELAHRLEQKILEQQQPGGSWHGLIVATGQAIHDLLDCGLDSDHPAIGQACAWLLAQQGSIDRDLFPQAPNVALNGMFYTARIEDEFAFEKRHHPEYGWRRDRQECLDLLPTYQTGAALSALCRCGYVDAPKVRKGFADLLRIRGPGGVNYEHHWCNCHLGRWLRQGVARFGTE
jgi:hypothetical protein